MRKKGKAISPPSPVAVDFFAGSGGLTLGLKRAGFDVRCAVEIDACAAETHRRNHPTTKLIQRDILEVSAADILDACGTQRISLVAGCAPCQGFCSLTSKWRREDPRNLLLLRMGSLIAELKPDCVLMENVPGVLTRGRAIFDKFLKTLASHGYYSNYEVVQMADHGVPQSRKRLVLMAGRGFAVQLPEPSHGRGCDLDEDVKPWVTLRNALPKLGAPVGLKKAIAGGGPRQFNWHVVRDLQAQTKARLRAATPGGTWLTLDDDLRPECHRNGYSGFTNVYGRMAWDSVASTLTGGCTTPCKGRFGHPDRRRTTISVREAAILQTFPASYRFESEKIDVVCEMIGNAVPPAYAKRAGLAVLKALVQHKACVAAAKFDAPVEKQQGE